MVFIVELLIRTRGASETLVTKYENIVHSNTHEGLIVMKLIPMLKWMLKQEINLQML